MNQEPTISDRKPWIAAALALFCTGLGHLYCGRIVRGMGLFLASLVFVPAAALAAVTGYAAAILVALGAAIGVYLAVLLFAVLDARSIARRAGKDYRLRDYNNGLVYAAFVLIGLTYPWGAAHLVRQHVLEAFLIPTASMAPSILPGDRLLVNKLEYAIRSPQRFDVIVFRAPENPQQRFVKRIIGLPGDTVEVQASRVRINGQDVLQQPAPLSPPLGSQGEIRWESRDGRTHPVLIGDGEASGDLPATPVPPGAFLVLGDNRDRSRDSRHFSFVPEADVIGEAQCIYYPALTWERFGAIE
jgi:signal peptidase I